MGCQRCEIRRALAARGWTVLKLSELVGAEERALSLWLRGRGAPPNADVIQRVLDVLGLR